MSENSPAAAERYSEDTLSTLFEPDILLPSQYFADDESGMHGGERKLMAALLSDGIEAYLLQCQSGPDSDQSKKTDAREWVETRDYTYVFSFDSVCACLGIDPEYLRLGLCRYVRAATGSTGEYSAKWKKIRRPRK